MALIDEPQVGLVHERGRLQRVCLPLAAQARRGAPAQLVVNDGHQPLARIEIAFTPCVKQRRHVAIRGLRHVRGHDIFNGRARAVKAGTRSRPGLNQRGLDRSVTIDLRSNLVGANWFRRGQGTVECMPSLLLSLVKPGSKTT